MNKQVEEMLKNVARNVKPKNELVISVDTIKAILRNGFYYIDNRVGNPICFKTNDELTEIAFAKNSLIVLDFSDMYELQFERFEYKNYGKKVVYGWALTKEELQ